MSDQLLSEINGAVGIITLNTEKTLNALTIPMIEALQEVLDQWKKDPAVACIFLQGAGEKAFCAGGDVRRLYDAIIAQRKIDPTKVPQDCFDFFCKEYRVDYTIHTYPKPVIVWGHGIVMGGGIGLMAGASHRIVTEKSKLAMPEITIGLFPDVGGTWFLNKMRDGIGLYLGLTGARMNPADCLHTGMADYFINAEHKTGLLATLQNAAWKNNNPENAEMVTSILQQLEAICEAPASPVKEHEAFTSLFGNIASVDEFVQVLSQQKDMDDWIQTGIKNFQEGSPSSAHIIFRQLQDGKQLTLEEVFQSELNLACQCTLHPDFAEGVRALLVDKDQQPKWNPATISDITTEWVNSYFEPLWNKDDHPLKDLGK